MVGLVETMKTTDSLQLTAYSLPIAENAAGLGITDPKLIPPSHGYAVGNS